MNDITARSIAEVDQQLIAEGVAALRYFGHDLTRDSASRLLGMWHYADRLTPAEHTAILAQFPAGPNLAEVLRLVQGIDRKLDDLIAGGAR
jgi:hypothetical protein